MMSLHPDLEQLLTRGGEGRAPKFSQTQIGLETVQVPMRDGVLLATDLYLPPVLPAPVIVTRTPYIRNNDRTVAASTAFARRGYAVVVQDCRGTGDSEPDHWDYYMFESEDGYDTVEWITRQSWYDGFIGSCGGSYVGQTQWPMATHQAIIAVGLRVREQANIMAFSDTFAVLGVALLIALAASLLLRKPRTMQAGGAH